MCNRFSKNIASAEWMLLTLQLACTHPDPLKNPQIGRDIATKEMLIAALSDFEGTMLFVSHDREFLAGLSTRVLELGAEGPVPYGGGYREYVARSGHEAPGLR